MFTAKSWWAVIWRSNHYYQIKNYLHLLLYSVDLAFACRANPPLHVEHLWAILLQTSSLWRFLRLFPAAQVGRPFYNVNLRDLRHICRYVNLNHMELTYWWRRVWLFTLKLEYLLYISAIPSQPHCSSVTVSLQEPSKLHWSSHLWCDWPLPASLHGPVALAAWIILTWHTISKRMLDRPAIQQIVLNKNDSNRYLQTFMLFHICHPKFHTWRHCHVGR